MSDTSARHISSCFKHMAAPFWRLLIQEHLLLTGKEKEISYSAHELGLRLQLQSSQYKTMSAVGCLCSSSSLVFSATGRIVSLEQTHRLIRWIAVSGSKTRKCIDSLHHPPTKHMAIQKKHIAVRHCHVRIILKKRKKHDSADQRSSSVGRNVWAGKSAASGGGALSS